jgi:phage gpG-like protein
MITKGRWNLGEVARKLATSRLAIKRDIGVLAVNQFKKNFRSQGFEDTSIDPWKARKKNYDKNKNQNRGILIGPGGGHLRKSIKILGMPGNNVIIGTSGIQYAKRHNSGLKGMPKRQFIGNSHKLETAMGKKIENHISKLWVQS